MCSSNYWTTEVESSRRIDRAKEVNIDLADEFWKTEGKALLGNLCRCLRSV
jgi:hypothetical protein